MRKTLVGIAGIAGAGLIYIAVNYFIPKIEIKPNSDKVSTGIEYVFSEEGGCGSCGKIRPYIEQIKIPKLDLICDDGGPIPICPPIRPICPWPRPRPRPWPGPCPGPVDSYNAIAGVITGNYREADVDAIKKISLGGGDGVGI